MVERFNSPKVEKPETSEEVIQEASSNLSNLKIEIKDKKKFETLLENPALKTGLDKIFKKESETVISTFWEGYKNSELNGHLFIESWTRRAIKTHPDLAGFICGDLGLPYEEITVRDMKNTKFSQLTFEQKMGFISFQEALRYYGNDISKVSSDVFIKQCKILTDEHIKSMTESFNDKLISSQNLVEEVTGLVNLKNFLKKEYGLTDVECKKMEEYIKLIHKHPEFVGGWTESIEGYEVNSVSKMAAPSIFGCPEFWQAIKRLIIAGLAIYGISELKSCSKLIPPETRVYGDHTEITNFKEVFKIMSAQVETDSNRRKINEDWLGHFDETTGNWIVKGVKRVGNVVIDGINYAQHRDLDLELKTETGYLFDFDTVKCNVKIEKGKGIFYIKVKKPEIKIISEDAKIYKSRRERINVDEFDDYDFRCVKILEKEAIDKASAPEKIEKAKESLRKQVLSVLKTTGYANSQMVILAEDVKDVIIEIEN